MDKIKPVHLYIFGGILGCIASLFRSFPAIHFTLVLLGLCFIIWGIVKYFKD